MNLIVSFIAFVIVVSVHEFAHGYAAYRLGDPTAKDAGRLTLNPAVHIDPVGTLVLPILLVLTNSPIIFGWAKPVPINPLNFSDRRKGVFITSLAGPASNFLTAVFFAMLFKTGFFPYGTSIVGTFLFNGVLISLVLGLFNLIPIPPLDGSGVLFSLLNPALSAKLAWLRKYGFVLLIALLYLGFLQKAIFPLVAFLTKLLLS